jgi:intracellular sulfur oxidation DsrE/DsrF family protein
MDDTVLLITRNGMGSAEVELQHRLLTNYLRLLLENGTLPGAICFYTDGVRLVTEGSPVLELLRQLEAKGVHLIVCQTCINYFALADRVRAGVVGGMGDILAAQAKAAKVITL